MGVLFALFMYFAGITILGRIVLKRIPSFGLTLANLVLFIIGATIGMLAFVNLFVYFIRLIGHFLARNIISIIQSGEGFLLFFLAALGAAIGGIGLVWLRMRFVKGHENKGGTVSSR
jgi:hypothetical protein